MRHCRHISISVCSIDRLIVFVLRIHVWPQGLYFLKHRTPQVGLLPTVTLLARPQRRDGSRQVHFLEEGKIIVIFGKNMIAKRSIARGGCNKLMKMYLSGHPFYQE